MYFSATGMYASLPSRRVEPQDRQTDRQMYFCIMDENYTKAEQSQRYVEVEVCNEHSIDQFENEIANAIK